MCGPCVSNVARLLPCVLALALVLPALLGSILLAAPEGLPLRASQPSPFLSTQALDAWVVHTAGRFRLQPPSGGIGWGNLPTSRGGLDGPLRGHPGQGRGPGGGAGAG